MRALMPPLLAACALCWGVALALGALASPRPARAARPTVVATTTQAADLVRAVGDGRVRVVALLAPNADPHEHEVTPGDVSALARARLVVRSGGDVDHWLLDAVRASGTRAPLLDLSESARLVADDPHWWQDPRNAERAVVAIRRALARALPDQGGVLRSATAAYLGRLRAADRAIATCWRAVPTTRRRLITTHDAYGYYARRYGLTVVGAVIPSLSTRGQPSAHELTRLVRTIRRLRIRALFTERALNARVEHAVAREAGARLGRPLWGDTLGPAGSAGATYLGALESDTHALLDGLTGGHGGACRLP